MDVREVIPTTKNVKNIRFIRFSKALVPDRGTLSPFQ